MSCGDYFCLKCGANFNTSRELDVHFRMHRKQNEDEKIDYEPSDGGYLVGNGGIK